MTKEEIVQKIRNILGVDKILAPKIVNYMPHATKEELLTVVTYFASLESND